MLPPAALSAANSMPTPVLAVVATNALRLVPKFAVVVDDPRGLPKDTFNFPVYAQAVDEPAAALNPILNGVGPVNAVPRTTAEAPAVVGILEASAMVAVAPVAILAAPLNVRVQVAAVTVEVNVRVASAAWA